MHSLARSMVLLMYMGSVLLVFIFGSPASIQAANQAEGNHALNISVTPEPAQFIFVNGDADRFQAHHWMQEGYTGGVKNFSSEYKLKDGIKVETEGHALIDQNDYEALVSVKKGDLLYLDFSYDEFRKYFDSSGGTYYPFGSMALGQFGNGYKRELFVDIGKMEVEFGIKPEHLPELIFAYERHFKNGTKSRLTWTSVVVGSTTRNIGPVFQEVDETVDSFSIKAKKDIGGFQAAAEQAFEFFGAETMREERSGTTNKIRRQTQNPRSFMAASVFEVERWFWKERVHFSSGYRFSHLNNDEFERLAEFDINYNPRSFANPKNKINAIAENDLDIHTWVASFLGIPWEWLSASTRFKAEAFRHKGHSFYPGDTTDPPDNVANTTEVGDTKSKGGRFGESVSLRFTKIPRTALYTELEFEQARLNMREDQASLAGQSASNANEVFGRDTLTDVLKGIWSLGGRVQPVSFIDITSQVRYRNDGTNYDDRRETAPGATTARSAFFDGQHRDVSELMTRVSLKHFRLLEPSFRYQLQDVKYATRFEGQPIVKTSSISHIYTFDVTSQPLDELLLTGSFSRQTSATRTPAQLSATANTPTFNADVDSWLFSGSYSFSEKLVANSAVVYSFSDNFNDFTNAGLPLGVDDQRLDLTASLRWTVNDRLTLEPKYAYYRYQANSNADAGGDYDVHLLLVEATVAWG